MNDGFPLTTSFVLRHVQTLGNVVGKPLWKSLLLYLTQMASFRLKITEVSGEKYLTLPPRVTMQSLRKDVVELLELQEGKFVLISRLAATFRKQHGRKFPLGLAKLEEFLRSMEGTAKVRWGQLFCMYYKNVLL